MQYEAESGDILMALTGESLITRAMKPFREPKFLELRDLLHSADVRFTNAEMLFHNYEDPPTFRPGGTYMRCDPRYIEDLMWLGINIVGTANNHSYDFGENGILTNLKYLDQYGMPYAGTSANMGLATKPVYVDTAKGRVALIAATSSGPIAGRAGHARPDVKGRPGSNFIRWQQHWVVEREGFDAAKLLADKLGWTEQAAARRAAGMGSFPPPSDTEVLFLDHGQYEEESFTRFMLGEVYERHSIINQIDLERNVRAVNDASRMADWVIFTIHNHEGGATPNEPSDHIIELAHAVIDAGAHVFTAHGPHQDRGLEIHNGRPIFYSLGDFVLQNDTVELMPQDNYERQGLNWDATPADFYDARSGNETRGQTVQPIRWQSVVPMVSFKGGKLAGIELHTADLGHGRPRSQRGRPVLGEGDVAKEILERFRGFSEPLGTKIKISDGTAVVEL